MDMLFFYDPKTETAKERIETRHPGFTAMLSLALSERKTKHSLRDQFVRDIVVFTGRKARATVDITETRKNGNTIDMRINLSLKDDLWCYGRWSCATEVIAWSGKEKF